MTKAKISPNIEAAQVTYNMKAAIYKLLMADRLANYGYGYSDFRRLQSQRQRAKQAIHQIGYANLTNENTANLLRRGRLELTVDEAGEFEASYTTGQSNNEEFTNLMRQWVNPNARWVS